MRPSPALSKRASACSPFASAACTRFSVAQPSETNRWWSSGSTAGQRREKSGVMAMDASATRNRQHWVLWLDGASVAQRTSSCRIVSASPTAAALRGRRARAACCSPALSEQAVKPGSAMAQEAAPTTRCLRFRSVSSMGQAFVGRRVKSLRLGPWSDAHGPPEHRSPAPNRLCAGEHGSDVHQRQAWAARPSCSDLPAPRLNGTAGTARGPDEGGRRAPRCTRARRRCRRSGRLGRGCVAGRPNVRRQPASAMRP